MKYYSDVTKAVYNTVAELEKAEKEVNDKVNARKRDAAEVDKAFNAMINARKNYEQVLSDFCAKHGSYHKTIKSEDVKENLEDLASLINFLKL